MTKRFFTMLLMLAPLGCGQDTESAKSSVGTGDANKSATGQLASNTLASITLAKDPGKALAISAAREVEAGQDVVVVGRIDKIVTAYASFTLPDMALDYCGQTRSEDGCHTPWDYCCIPSEEKAAATLMVMVDAADGVGAIEAEELPGLRLLDAVVVKGKLQKDEFGNVIVHATGWFKRERPELREGLHWPG